MTAPICAIIEKCQKEEPVKPTGNPCAAASCNVKSYKGGCVPHCGVGKTKEYCKAVCVVCNRKKLNANPIYTEQLKSGYAGHVPMSNFQLGLSFPEAGIIGLAEFEAARKKKLKCKEKNNISLNNCNNNLNIEELRRYSQTSPAVSGCCEECILGNRRRRNISLCGSKTPNVSMNANGGSQVNMSKNNAKEDSQNKATNLKMEPRNIAGFKGWRYNLVHIPESVGLEPSEDQQEPGINCVICPCPVPIPKPNKEAYCPLCEPEPCRMINTAYFYGPCLNDCDGCYVPIPPNFLRDEPIEPNGSSINNGNNHNNCGQCGEKYCTPKVKLEPCGACRPCPDCKRRGKKKMGAFQGAESELKQIILPPVERGFRGKTNIMAYPNPTPCCGGCGCFGCAPYRAPCGSEPTCYCQSKRPSKYAGCGTMKNYESCPSPPPRPLYIYYTEKVDETKCDSESPCVPPNCCFVPCGALKTCECDCDCCHCACGGLGACCGDCNNGNNEDNCDTNGSNNKDINEACPVSEDKIVKDDLCGCNIYTCVPTPAFIPENVICPCPCQPAKPKALCLTRNPPANAPITCCKCCKPAVPFNAALYPQLANLAIQTWANAKQRSISFELCRNNAFVLPEDGNKYVDASLNCRC